MVRQAAASPATSWVQSLALERIEAGVAHLTSLPGHRDVIKFVAGARRDQLAGMLRQVLGQPVRIDLQAPAVTDASAPATADAAAGSPLPAGGSMDRQEAMSLPLVKQLRGLFDLTIVDIRPEQAAAAPARSSADQTADNPAPAGSDPAVAGGMTSRPHEAPREAMLDDAVGEEDDER